MLAETTKARRAINQLRQCRPHLGVIFDDGNGDTHEALTQIFQSVVSPICNRQIVTNGDDCGTVQPMQIENLRY